MKDADSTAMYDARDVFLWEQRHLEAERTAQHSRVGPGGPAASKADSCRRLHEELIHHLNELRIEHNMSDRCVGDVISFCQLLQQRTATLLGLPQADLTAQRAMPSKALSGWKTKVRAEVTVQKVSWLLRAHAALCLSSSSVFCNSLSPFRRSDCSEALRGLSYLATTSLLT